MNESTESIEAEPTRPGPATAAPTPGATATATPKRRLPGPDVVRALAMAGVVIMNYHGYMILESWLSRPTDPNWADRLFDPWEGPLSTRFAATFVVVAGVGVALMSRRARTDPSLGTALSWKFVRRGTVLYLFGLAFDTMWAGTILPYYGAMFILAAVLWRLPNWALGAIGATAALAGWILHGWATNAIEVGRNIDWLIRPDRYSASGLVLNVFVNGTHPLLPWLAFFCAGIALGRAIDRPVVLRVTFAVGTMLWIVATAIGLAAESDPGYRILLSPHPFDRGIVYTSSALGTALMATIAINAAANRAATSPVTDALRRAGQLSLTIYLGHAVVFELLVNRFGLVKPTARLAPSLVFALSYWVIAIAAAIGFQRRFGRGPAEWVYRKVTFS